MIYRINDFSKVEKLFNDWPYPDWHKVMNLKVEIYADDPESPKSAVGEISPITPFSKPVFISPTFAISSD